MASKHSKNIFDFRKNVLLAPTTPRSKDDTSAPLPIKIIMGVLIASLVLSLIVVGREFLPGVAHKNMLKKASATFWSTNSKDGLDLLAKKNPDIKAWLKIEESPIDYAVCQGKDDKYYTNHNQRGSRSRYGALMFSSSDDITRAGGDKNLVIFGNNMKDGSMFGSLKEYRKIEFYRQHPVINLYSADQKENYAVFAVMLLSATDNGNSYYQPNKSYFLNREDFDKWYDEGCARSLISTPVEAEYGDDILTLVTVASDFEGARLVVMAKKVDDWTAERIDTTAATVNSHIKYPPIWYQQKGLDYPH